MTPTKFPEQIVIIAEHQPQYQPLPAHINDDEATTLTFCWQLTWRERFALLFGGKIWHQVLTFGQPLQPQLLLVDKPNLPPRKWNAARKGVKA